MKRIQVVLLICAAVIAGGCRSAPFARLIADAQPEQATTREFKVAGIFTDNMVLQQGALTPVWGWADDGEKVTVTFRNLKVRATARQGRWIARLPNLQAGGPDVLMVSAQGKEIQFTNVLVGEVWICSGQSNMEWPMTKAFQPQEDIANSANPDIRLFMVPKRKADTPVDDVQGQWRESGPEAVADFSAVAYYFGRELQKARGVPIGLIQVAWGGSPAEVWMSQKALEANARYRSEILEAYPTALKNYEELLAATEKENAVAKAAGQKTKALPRVPWKPAELYNGMLAPIIPYAIKGAIWYQGESNASRAHQYRSLFPDMIGNWRRDWGQGDFPFLAVQLAPFKAIQQQPVESDWAELREAQLLATKALPRVGLAVITDVGEERDIHPAKKAPVGGRLALAARSIAYNEKIVFSGPTYKSMRVEGSRVFLEFDNVGSGLEARGGALKGFAICGPDRKFVWARAEIQPDNTIVVQSPNVVEPVAVRYGWADFPVVNLWNKEGLPASPFRTDDFPMITAPKN